MWRHVKLKPMTWWCIQTHMKHTPNILHTNHRASLYLYGSLELGGGGPDLDREGHVANGLGQDHLGVLGHTIGL
jgi:hypothetical protein